MNSIFMWHFQIKNGKKTRLHLSFLAVLGPFILFHILTSPHQYYFTVAREWHHIRTVLFRCSPSQDSHCFLIDLASKSTSRTSLTCTRCSHGHIAEWETAEPSFLMQKYTQMKAPASFLVENWVTGSLLPQNDRQAKWKIKSECPYIREHVGLSSGTLWFYNKHM